MVFPPYSLFNGYNLNNKFKTGAIANLVNPFMSVTKFLVGLSHFLSFNKFFCRKTFLKSYRITVTNLVEIDQTV